MRFGDIVTFRKDIFFEGAVQIDWFTQPTRAALVAENFVFHGSEYFGVSDENGTQKLTDTIQFVHDIVSKTDDEQLQNPLTLAIAGYGTGKSHLAVTLSQLLSGSDYLPKTYQKIIRNISAIDKEKATAIAAATRKPNLVLTINGMKDFNLHYELLKAAQRSLKLYGCSDENLKKLNRALETAFRFFEINAESQLSLFETYAPSYGYQEKGAELIAKIKHHLGEDDAAFLIINAVYQHINGNEIRWDEGVSASAVLDTLLTEYCGISGPFNHIFIIFDEFGRYLEYASTATSAQSGDSALQQIFESTQNAEGAIHVVNFIQSDIKTYLQRVDQTSTISRYIGRYDASEKYYLSSNLETVFANLIQRSNDFSSTIKPRLDDKEDLWQSLFQQMGRWLPVQGTWKSYKLFRRVAVEGIYPLHPVSTYMLTQLSDYLQNRSSLTLLSRYIETLSQTPIDSTHPIPLVYPEELLAGDLYTEMLSAEEEGRQLSQHCIRLNNIFRKLGDKLSLNSSKVLRANLALRILRFRTNDYQDAKSALSICSGLSTQEIDAELIWLENEYAVLGFDEHVGCFDFLEDSSGAHDFRTFFRRIRAGTIFSPSILEESSIREMAGVLTPQSTNFANIKKIKTNEWQFEQDVFAIGDLSTGFLDACIATWHAAVSPDKIKGKLIWLYVNRDTDTHILSAVQALSQKLENTPIILMLLNDTEDKLKSALWDYSALNTVAENDRKKYGRHYEDALSQSEYNIRSAFDTLRKQRLCIKPDAIAPLENRLAISLTSVFESVYPNAISFDFDGFDSKQPSRARKAYCSITRLLLSGSLSDNMIHSFPADIRNRLDATLFANGTYSWKCINSNYQICPPQQSSAAKIYDFITQELQEDSLASCQSIYDQLTKPPYGMNDYGVVYMLSVVLANLSYCLRMTLNNETYSVQSWKEKVIDDSKINLPLLLKI
ncbi:hypothetical protein RFF05_12670 [Bengtsoniella intestinalis]|uniref:hypothetical protein n=1 Tax=Bengtsoniella intestinalis TaxID=3073143 RepID=UPI00391F0534